MQQARRWRTARVRGPLARRFAYVKDFSAAPRRRRGAVVGMCTSSRTSPPPGPPGAAPLGSYSDSGDRAAAAIFDEDTKVLWAGPGPPRGTPCRSERSASARSQSAGSTSRRSCGQWWGYVRQVSACFGTHLPKCRTVRFTSTATQSLCVTLADATRTADVADGAQRDHRMVTEDQLVQQAGLAAASAIPHSKSNVGCDSEARDLRKQNDKSQRADLPDQRVPTGGAGASVLNGITGRPSLL